MINDTMRVEKEAEGDIIPVIDNPVADSTNRISDVKCAAKLSKMSCNY